MKKLLFPLVSGLLSVSPAFAASPPHPLVTDSAETLATAIDFNHDSRSDMVLVDKTTGLMQVAAAQLDGSFVWATPRGVGGLPTAMTAGSVADVNGNAVLVTSPEMNRVHVLQDNQPGPVSLVSWGFGPHGIALTRGAGPADPPRVLVGSEWDFLPNPTVREIVSGFPTSSPSGFASSLQNIRQGQPTGVSEVGFLNTQSGPSLHLVNLATTTLAPVASLALPVDYSWSYGNFSGTYDTYLLWKKGLPTLHTHQLTRSGLTGTFGADVSHALTSSIESLTVIPGPTTTLRFAVVHSGGAEVRIYSYDGASAPAVVQAFTPSGADPLGGVLAMGNGDFATFRRLGNGLYGAQRYFIQPNGKYAPGAESVSPLGRTGHARSNVVLTEGEPFVAVAPQLRALWQSGDWTQDASGLPGTVSLTKLTSGTSANGLGTPALVSLGGPSSGTTHILTNQIADDISMMPLLPTSGDQSTSSITFTPPPGHYPPASIDEPFRVTVAATSEFAPIFYRTGPAENWSFAQGSATLTFTSGPYVEIHAFTLPNGPGGNSPITRATFHLANSSPVPANDSDLNGDGLGDAWANFFNITNPNADADGDGATNIEEYNGGSNPLSNLERPITGDDFHVATLAEPGDDLLELRWPANDPRLVLEESDSLTGDSWAAITSGIIVSGGENIYRTPISENRRFFRVRRR